MFRADFWALASIYAVKKTVQLNNEFCQVRCNQSFQAIPLSGCAAIIFIHITSAVSTAFYSQVKLQANEHFLQDNLECKIPQLDLTFKWGRKVVLEAINLFTLTLLRIAPLHLFQIWT